MDNRQAYGTPFSRHTQATPEAVAIIAAQGAGRIHYITDISGSTDAPSGDTTVTVKVDNQVRWRDQLAQNFSLGSSTNTYTHSFKSPISGSANVSVSIIVGSSTTACYANMSGFTL